MREHEISVRTSKYKQKKPIPMKYIIIGYSFVALLFLFAVITTNKMILFLFVTFFSSLVNYQTNVTTIRFNPDPEVFFGLLLTRVMGFQYALVMLLLPTLFIDIYTARLDKDTAILAIAVCYVMSILNYNFVAVGIILVTIKFIIGLVLNAILDISPQEIMFEHVLGFITNMVVFLAFGDLLLNLFT